MQGKTSSKKYWNDLYDNGDTGWDIGFPSPAITNYVDHLPDKTIPILIPGCGNAYEAEYLLAQNFTNISLIDFAPTVTKVVQEKFKKDSHRIRIITGDFFDHMGSYQQILEQTFLSALDPSVRPKYVEKMHSLLQTGGHLTGVLFSKIFDDSPPYGGTIAEYSLMFARKFEIRKLEPCYNSIDRRQGSEAFIDLVAK